MSSPFGTPQPGAPSSFGTPQPATQQLNGAAVDATAPNNDPQEILDPNDPRLISEDISVNAEGDAYAQPAPPPDTKWRCKLKLEGVKDANGQKHDYLPKLTKDKLPYFATGISASIIDPSGKYDGVLMYDSWVGTFMNRDGSTKVSTILRLLKQPDGNPWVEIRPNTAPAAKVKAGQRLTHKEWMDLLVTALAGEPEIGVLSQWEWSCQTCSEEAKAAHKAYPKSIQGMTKFPPEQDKAKVQAGQRYSPEMACQANKAHGYSRARATIASFVAL